MTTYAAKDVREREVSVRTHKELGAFVKDILRTQVSAVPPDLDIHAALQALVHAGASCLVVLGEEDRPLGIVTDSDLLSFAICFSEPMPSVALRQILQDEPHIRKFLKEKRKREAAQVSEVMSSPVICADAEMTLGQAAAIMSAYGYSRLPVIRAGRVVGLLTRRDILLALTDGDA